MPSTGMVVIGAKIRARRVMVVANISDSESRPEAESIWLRILRFSKR